MVKKTSQNGTKIGGAREKGQGLDGLLHADYLQSRRRYILIFNKNKEV
jgi:hypothetical protein